MLSLPKILSGSTVAPVHGIGVARLPAPHGYPSYTRERWLRIAGCDSLVYMKASFTGRLFSVRDKGGCLKSAAAPTAKSSTGPAPNGQI